jgi:hypothetical protein
MTGSSVATPGDDWSISGTWFVAEGDASTTVTSGRLIKVNPEGAVRYVRSSKAT